MRCHALALTATLLALLPGCGGGGGSAGGGGTPLPDGSISWLLTSEHMGYKAQHCQFCHEPTAQDCPGSTPPECVACHGANGAPDPNGIGSQYVHALSDACIGCHGEGHGFRADSHCVACHFATVGVDPNCCGDGIVGAALRPAEDLTSGSFGWPALDFTPENKAPVEPVLSLGDAAIDFTLRTVAGDPVRLADLLATRPVLLVLGSFT